MVNVEFAERPFDVSLRAVVLSSAERITAGKSRPKLIISHRFPMVRVADLIVVLENGRVVES